MAPSRSSAPLTQRPASSYQSVPAKSGVMNLNRFRRHRATDDHDVIVAELAYADPDDAAMLRVDRTPRALGSRSFREAPPSHRLSSGKAREGCDSNDVTARYSQPSRWECR
jgi:hypothetical protein